MQKDHVKKSCPLWVEVLSGMKSKHGSRKVRLEKKSSRNPPLRHRDRGGCGKNHEKIWKHKTRKRNMKQKKKKKKMP